ncbi:MAG: hypothetical protein ABI671_16130 [Burkholderiales bacterium]
MPLRNPLRSRSCTSPRNRPAPTFGQPSRIQEFAVACLAFAQTWRERGRIKRAHRSDPRMLAGMGERDRSDFDAPRWLRSDVGRYC